jgi:hypothetical protein
LIQLLNNMARPPLSSFMGGSTPQPQVKPPLESFAKPTAPAGKANIKTPFEITQEFGQASQYDTQTGGVNYGRDYATPPGTPVSLPKGKWRVVNIYDQADPQGGSLNTWDNQGYGNSVLVKNEDTGEYQRFSHLSDVHVQPDQIVNGGVIATTGASGHVTGPHLDQEVYDSQGNLIDPRKTPYANPVTQNRQVDVTGGLETPDQPQSASLMPQIPSQNAPGSTPTPKAILPPVPVGNDYQGMARKSARQYGIPEDLMAAQIQQESNWDPNADSGQAKGISQFTPETGRAYGLRVDDKVDDRLNPAKAMDAQGRMMRDLLKQHGSEERALSAYNSGNPDAYLDPSFAQGQTYNYVQRIQSSRKVKK